MTDLIELPLAAPRALRAVVDLLGRMPEVERAVAKSTNRVQGVLDEVLERVRPVEGELAGLRRSASGIEDRLAASNRELETLSELTSQLTAVAARLEGATEHVLDRVPGLSSQKAADRTSEVVEETSGGIDGN